MALKLFVFLPLAISSASSAEGQIKSGPFLRPTPCPEIYGPAVAIACDPAKLRALTALAPGQNVAVLPPDYLTGGPQGDIGYYAHMFARFVGPQGHVFDVIPPEIDKLGGAIMTIGGRKVTGDYSDRNVTKLVMNFRDLRVPNRLDVVWSVSEGVGALSYFSPLQASSFYGVAASLKFGGRFIVLDADTQKHCGRPTADCPADGPILLHDLPHDSVLHSIESAGFRLESESRPSDHASSPLQAGHLFSHSMKDGTHFQAYWFLWEFTRTTT